MYTHFDTACTLCLHMTCDVFIPSVSLSGLYVKLKGAALIGLHKLSILWEFILRPIFNLFNNLILSLYLDFKYIITCSGAMYNYMFFIRCIRFLNYLLNLSKAAEFFLSMMKNLAQLNTMCQRLYKLQVNNLMQKCAQLLF